MKWYSNDTQISWVCNALIDGRTITHRDEIAEVRGWRLAAVIHRLRTRYKWPITTVYDDAKVAHYKLGKAEQLEVPKSYKKAIKSNRN